MVITLGMGTIPVVQAAPSAPKLEVATAPGLMVKVHVSFWTSVVLLTPQDVPAVESNAALPGKAGDIPGVADLMVIVDAEVFVIIIVLLVPATPPGASPETANVVSLATRPAFRVTALE